MRTCTRISKNIFPTNNNVDHVYKKKNMAQLLQIIIKVENPHLHFYRENTLKNVQNIPTF